MITLLLACAVSSPPDDSSSEVADSAGETTRSESPVPFIRVTEPEVCGEDNQLRVAAPTAEEGEVVGLQVRRFYTDGVTFSDSFYILGPSIVVNCMAGEPVSLTLWIMPP